MSVKTTLVAGLFAAFSLTPAWAGDIEIQNAYARAASPNAKSGAAFMTVHSRADTDDRLVGVSSPVAARVELHTHEEDANGVMRMLHVEQGFDLPAGGRIMMERGGKHVMFMGLNEGFEQGKKIPLTLIFEQAGPMEVEIEVDLERQGGHGEGHEHGSGS